MIGDFFRRGRELPEELFAHIEERVADLVESGVAEREARQQARREFGNPTRYLERSREIWGWARLSELGQDLRYAVRQMRRSQGFTLMAVLSLALGIGANTALFSLVDAVLLKNLPVRDPSRLYFVDNVGTKGPNGAPPYPCFELMRDGTHSFAGMAAFAADRFNVSIQGRIEQVRGQLASASYFEVLGVTSAAGRVLIPDDDGLNPPVAVISYAYWQRRFGGDPAAIGEVIRYQERSVTIVGVTPPAFLGIQPGSSVDITLPITMADPPMLRSRSGWWINSVARLKPQVSAQQARAEVEPIFRNYMAGLHDLPVSAALIKEDFDHMELLPASKGMDELRRRFSVPLAVLMTIVGLVLLIGCANLANLLMARASSRRREFAVRLAIGAGRGRLVRQILTETLLLFSWGAAMGLAVASWGIQLLTGYFAVGRSPILLDAHLDLRVLAFTATLTLLTGLLFGLAPALGAVRADPYPALQEAGTRSTSSRARAGMRQLLVVGQVTLSLVLVVAAGFFVRTLANLDRLDPGFQPEHVVTLSVQPVGSESQQPQRFSAFWTDILNNVERIPGVRSVSISQFTPLTGGYHGVLISVPGFEARSDHDKQVRVNQVSDAYFETLGIPILRGRSFTPSDNESAPKVAILNESAAKFYFGDRNPLGAKVDLPRPNRPNISERHDVSEVVGVVRDTKDSSLREEAPRFVFLPVLQRRDGVMRLTLAVKASGDPSTLLAAVQKQVHALGSNVLVTEAMLMREQVDATLVQERLLSVLSGFFGALALLLSAVGLYGVLAQIVHQKTNEIGVRIALGARGGQVVWMVLSRSIGLVGIGVALGVPAALLAMWSLKSLLFGLTPTDVPTLLVGAGVLLATAAVASYLPARRAARIDPMIALRYE